ncbi:uncharacterized protein CPUR_04153 [Claviceps purpurea 20.1]|uniref:Uncharacterized protein n=1 Tax=Claviceps purpurea (strain 20.1) TaxID=1111077 RepID=M1W643_CLAP2|nr:hypothetical protein E4U27_006548 [Claviceps purpurea]KAG6213388.1 hypothetical protein E4U50_001276 [Claviceps purpurea]KAG6221148.1 hypothetical protein E4U26_006155 [Claviceps purpurea]KAG6227543.1 hypothetical protein E4U34_005549 [Claviceps purpurea]CCE30305.1 uncharacterized protein CPUR_04153 [Claviceps purpurea 20.1]
MHSLLVPAILLLGVPGVLARAVAATAESTNPILSILTNITGTSESLSEQAGEPMDIDLDRQYKGSVRYFVKFIQDLNRTNNNFPQLPNGLNASEQRATCNYFDRDFYRSQTRLPNDIAAKCYSSGTKGAWCNYLVICLRAYIPILEQVERKIVSLTPRCALEQRIRMGTIRVFQGQAVVRIELGRYYRKLPFTVPAEGDGGDILKDTLGVLTG